MTTVKAAQKSLRAHALMHPGAWEDEPWEGDHVVKVGKKIFAFLGGDGPDLSLGVKLPRSVLFARAQRFVTKMGYGMDKSGWVAVRFAGGDHVPLDLLRSWVDESYDAVAATALPKRGAPRVPPRKTAARRR